MSKLDEMKKNYQNIEIPEELKERVEKGISEGKQASKHRILPFAKGIGIVAAACGGRTACRCKDYKNYYDSVSCMFRMCRTCCYRECESYGRTGYGGRSGTWLDRKSGGFYDLF